MKLKYFKEDWWLYLGCWLTGYNYEIVRQCSEISKKNVRKMFSALLLVMIIWAFIGYSFVQRYLKGDIWESIIGMLLMIFIVVQIERQIILTMHKKAGVAITRILIGLIMAIIGSIILDQIIFKEDIEIAKHDYIQEKVAEILPQKTHEIQNRINELKEQVRQAEAERMETLKEIQRQPTILVASRTHVASTRDTATGAIKEEKRNELTTAVNPKMAYLSSLDKKIAELNGLIDQYQQRMINIHLDLENDLRGKTGFLDEIKVMIKLLTSSTITMFVWGLFGILFLLIEILVLINKLTDTDDDYHWILKHQLEAHLYKLSLLKNNTEENVQE